MRQSQVNPCTVESLEVRAMLAADLVGSFAASGNTLPSPLVPGDAGKVPVIVTNQGDAVASGPLKVKLYLSADQTFDGGDALIASGGQQIDLAAGTSLTITLNAYVPVNQAPDDYYLLVVVDADGDILEADELNNTAVEGDPRPLVWKFGTFDGRKNVSLTLAGATLTPGGVTSVFSIRGPGWGEVTPNLGVFGPGQEAPFAVSVSETTRSSSVTVTASDTGASFESVTVNGPLGKFLSGQFDVVGDMDFAGVLGRLDVLDIVGQAGDELTISVGAGPRSVDHQRRPDCRGCHRQRNPHRQLESDRLAER